MFSNRISKSVLLIFVALIVATTIFLFPQETTSSEMPGACADCANKCKVKVCTWWVPGPSAQCPNPGSGGGCCLREELVCDPDCESPLPDSPPTLSSDVTCSAWGSNGWCIGSASLDFIATESKGRTMLLYGNILGTDFSCNNGNEMTSPASCSVPLPEGNATASISATSSINLTGTSTQAWKRDVTAPSINGTFNQSANGLNWFNTAVNLTASVSDALSGVASIEYSYDNANWSPYVSPLSMSEGISTVYFRTKDQAGNTATLSKTVQVDSQSPQLSKTLSGTLGNAPWYVSDVQVEIVPSDPAPSSGTQYFAYNLGAGWVPYTTPFSIPEGVTTLKIHLVDNADNEAISASEIKVDTTPPSISGSLDQSPNALGWFNTSVNLTASASDITSGVANLNYSFNNVSWTPYTSALNFTDGSTTLYLTADDLAGNSRTISQEIKVDTQLPTISYQINGTTGESGWYISETQVEVFQSDPAPSSGIQFFRTSLDGISWTAYTAPLDFTDGTYVLQMHVSDNADNQDLDGIALNVDTTPPQISATRAGTQGSANFYTSAVTYTMTANDDTSGIALRQYSLDGSAWLSYVAPLTIEDGFHKLQFRTKDVAGLYAYTEVYEFQVDTHGPNIKLPSRWYIWEQGDLFVKDETSKIKSVTFEVRDAQNRWKKVEQDWSPNTHEYTRSLSWNRIFGDGVRAPIGTYFVTIYAEDYAGNTSKKTAEIIIPGVDATPLPTFTPTPIPTNTPVPTEPPAENPETMLATVTATPFVFTGVIQPPAEGGDTPSTFGDTPQTPKKPSDSNLLLAIAAAAAAGAFVATSKKEQTFTLEEEKAAEETASDVVYGSAAAATIAAYKAQNGERMRRARLESKRAKEEKRLKERAAMQALWDANGAAIYDANQDFKKNYGKEMDAATREQAIKDATVGGVFNAGAYATNLNTAHQIAKYRERQERARKVNPSPTSQNSKPPYPYTPGNRDPWKDIDHTNRSGQTFNSISGGMSVFHWRSILWEQQSGLALPSYFYNFPNFPDTHCTEFTTEGWRRAGIQIPGINSPTDIASYRTPYNQHYASAAHGEIRYRLNPELDARNIKLQEFMTEMMQQYNENPLSFAPGSIVYSKGDTDYFHNDLKDPSKDVFDPSNHFSHSVGITENSGFPHIIEMSGPSSFLQNDGGYVGEWGSKSYWKPAFQNSSYNISERSLFGGAPAQTIFREGNEIVQTVDHLITAYSIVPAVPITPANMHEYGIQFELAPENKVTVMDTIRNENNIDIDVAKEECYINPDTKDNFIQEIYCPPSAPSPLVTP